MSQPYPPDFLLAVLQTVAFIALILAFAFSYALITFAPGTRARAIRPYALVGTGVPLAIFFGVFVGWDILLMLALVFGGVSAFVWFVYATQSWLATPVTRDTHPTTEETPADD